MRANFQKSRLITSKKSVSDFLEKPNFFQESYDGCPYCHTMMDYQSGGYFIKKKVLGPKLHIYHRFFVKNQKRKIAGPPKYFLYYREGLSVKQGKYICQTCFRKFSDYRLYYDKPIFNLNLGKNFY